MCRTEIIREWKLAYFKEFHANLGKSFSQILETEKWGTDASKTYQKVTRELIKMKRLDADSKHLIIYSDMLENSNLFTFYGTNWKSNIEKMLFNPELTLEKLSKNGPALPDLSEFHIHVISTRTLKNDEKINISEQLWAILLEYQGAVVCFNSDLEIL